MFARIKTIFSGMLDKDKRAGQGFTPFKRFDATQRPENIALRVERQWPLERSNACKIVPLSRLALSLPAAIVVAISTSQTLGLLSRAAR